MAVSKYVTDTSIILNHVDVKKERKITISHIKDVTNYDCNVKVALDFKIK